MTGRRADLIEDPTWRASIARFRDEGRADEKAWLLKYMAREVALHESEWSNPWPGGCSWMAETIERDYGWSEDGGCYLTSIGHIAHQWNVLPDGRILDTTADQFGDSDVPVDGIRVVSESDPRYDRLCDGEDNVG